MSEHNLEKFYSLSRGRPRYSSALDSIVPAALPPLKLMLFQRPPALELPKSVGRAFPCKALKSFYLRCRRRFLPGKPPSQRQLLCRQKILPAAGSLSVQSHQPKKRKTFMTCPPEMAGPPPAVYIIKRAAWLTHAALMNMASRLPSGQTSIKQLGISSDQAVYLVTLRSQTLVLYRQVVSGILMISSLSSST